MTSLFVTHARTPEELRAEVLSDLNRRIDNLQRQEQATVGAVNKAKINRAIIELSHMLDFWTIVRIEKTVRKRSPLEQHNTRNAAE